MQLNDNGESINKILFTKFLSKAEPQTNNAFITFNDLESCMCTNQTGQQPKKGYLRGKYRMIIFAYNSYMILSRLGNSKSEEHLNDMQKHMQITY